MPRIRLLGDVKYIRGVAVSGGPDSMALLNFLRKGRHKPIAYFFDHGTKSSKYAKEFVTEYCSSERIKLVTDGISPKKQKAKRESWEEFWRNERYAFLHRQQCVIATAHHLNDVAETYLWGIANGQTRHIHYCKPINDGPSNVVRPFLLTPKKSLLEWCYKNSIPFITDASNKDLAFTRNRIRHNVVPEMEKINPGFLKTVSKIAFKKFYQSTLWRNMLTKKSLTGAQLSAYHEAIRISVDPESAFAGKVDFSDLHAMPIAVQKQIYDSLPEDVKKLLNG